jgi:hypothetical protein
MSRRPLLALLRGPDGRSLARALAAIVFVNVLLAGLHGGALAYSATTDTSSVCTSAGVNSDPGHPANDSDRRAYGMVGYLTTVTSIVTPSSPVLAGAPPTNVLPAFVPLPVGHTTPDPLDRPANPRGPPCLG